ncbi:type II toxin-antitoxin system RelE/ParE family toxin [Streptosporangium canum]|uniref:type II toxin-antitoxin system RelE/ParE family toxin n=1 Tax=Streptosporangium canum TaxID=324952 RepID=UPI0036889F82
MVSKEIHEILQGKPPMLELGNLMQRIEDGVTLRRDTKHLGKGLHEARLTYETNEYRLYYAVNPQGEHILLALKFHMKGSSGAQDRAMEVARDRLAEWRGRI